MGRRVTGGELLPNFGVVLDSNIAGPVMFLFSAIRLGSFLFGELRVKDVASAQVLGHPVVTNAPLSYLTGGNVNQHLPVRVLFEP